MTQGPVVTREFVIPPNLVLRLEGRKTVIYVGGRRFQHCQVLLLNLPVREMKDLAGHTSIDELTMQYHSRTPNLETAIISPEEEFWGHCSNLQAWADHDYDTRLLTCNLAFPLLKALVDAGDDHARAALGREVTARLATGYPPVVKYLVEEHFYKYLSADDLDALPIDALAALLGTKLYDHYPGYFKRIVAQLPPFIRGEQVQAILRRGKFDADHQHVTKAELERLTQFKYQIKSLSLDASMLKSLPDSIGNLTSLEYLDLKCNQLRFIPESIGNLLLLRTLSLSRNELRSILDSLGNLASLEFLFLGKNQLRSIPDSLGNLTSLRIIDLNHNQLRSLPESVTNLKLESLSLTGNEELQISPTVANWMEDLPNAQRFGGPPQRPRQPRFAPRTLSKPQSIAIPPRVGHQPEIGIIVTDRKRADANITSGGKLD